MEFHFHAVLIVIQKAKTPTGYASLDSESVLEQMQRLLESIDDDESA